MDPWDKVDLTWHQLRALPKSWRAPLGQWRGVYYIFDTSDCLGYVGAAYGEENILGRWKDYAKSGRVDNKNLRDRDPANFQFTILQRVSPDMEPKAVIEIEGTWKDRLHTRKFGLNNN